MKLATSIALIAAFAAVASASTLVKPNRNNIQATGNLPGSRFLPPEQVWPIVVATGDCVVLNGLAEHTGPLVELMARPEITEEYKFACFEELWELHSDKVIMCMFGACKWDELKVIAMEEAAKLVANAPIDIPEEAQKGYIANVEGCFPALQHCIENPGAREHKDHVVAAEMIAPQPKQDYTWENVKDLVPEAYYYYIPCIENNGAAKNAATYFIGYVNLFGLPHWIEIGEEVWAAHGAEITDCVNSNDYAGLLKLFKPVSNIAFTKQPMLQWQAEAHAMSIILAILNCPKPAVF